MHSLLIHPATNKAIRESLNSTNHAYLLMGRYGAGKGYLASFMADQWLGGAAKPHQTKHLGTDKPVGIDEIRELQLFLKLKVAGSEKVRRVIIIENASLMTLEAQNALLKTLEEPPTDTRIVLTAVSANALRPTVVSRLQIINVQPCTLEELNNYLKNNHIKLSSQDIEKAYLISGGQVGLCLALLQAKDHPLVGAIGSAKQYLTASQYERLIKVDVLAKDRENLSMFMFALQRVLASAVRTNKSNLEHLSSGMKAVYDAQEELANNPNMKLLLTNLAINL